MSTIWILVADQARARLFELCENGASLNELQDFVNPQGRAPEHDQGTDRPARVHESNGATRHAIEPHTSLREKSADRFARELRTVLERGRVEHRYEKLVLIAVPKFLGTLRATFGKPLQRCISDDIARDMTSLRPDEILDHLKKSRST
ncbi:MAG: host attachment protein [Rudaea sp.]